VGVSSYENRYGAGNWSWATASFFASINTDQASAPWTVDYDGDGDFDIFVGNFNGTVWYYENTGTASSPKWTYDKAGGGNIDVGSWARPTLGDLDDDGDLDMVVGASDGHFYYYEKVISSPVDPAIDVGDDGDNEWTYSGELETSVVARYLAAEFQSHLNGSYSHQDPWGNRFHDVPINFISASPGVLRIDQMRIVFEYTARTTDFTAILNDYISDNMDKANDEGYLKVPIIVTSGSNGRLKLSNLHVVVDRSPSILDIPSTYAIDEDTKNLRLIDLTDYVNDDITSFEDMTIKVVQIDQAGIVKVYLVDGRYVGVDAETGDANDNWHGTVSVQVKVWDGLGQGAESGVFTIEVRPVNDAPTLGKLPPSQIYEDEPFEFKLEAFDVDRDPLSFTAISIPTGMTVSTDGL
ncbi:MAG: VCBS repeat-containing protein, partial [Thermoplasmata archaeon]|nr:VCBS repeat-containing protein [Thermoplasmata archaeon]